MSNIKKGQMCEMLTRHGERFAGNNVEDVAQEWIDNGFSADGADSWCDIGVWEASVAAQLRDAGLAPQQVGEAAQRLIDAEDAKYTDGDPIYSICNGDTNIDRLIAESK